MSMLHQIGLTFIPGVGSVTAQQLVNSLGSAEAVFSANKKQLLEVPGVGPKLATELLQNTALRRAEEELKFVEKHKIEVLFCNSDHYPSRLKHCYDAPVLLYYKGKANLNEQRIVGIVGTRNASAYGKQICNELIKALKAKGVLVVSGLAYGIDIAAHKACLQFGVPTIGVMAHGLDRIYPNLHRDTASKMLEQGGLLTEFPMGTNPDKVNFPKRNRIIAGMTDATIVVEAAASGGALITAGLANSYDRDVFAFPGRVTDEYSKGCNFLIKTNRAALINDAQDLAYMMNWEDILANDPIPNTVDGDENLSEDEQLVMALLEKGPLGIDALLRATAMGQGKLAMLLLGLEMKRLIQALPGSMYRFGA